MDILDAKHAGEQMAFSIIEILNFKADNQAAKIYIKALFSILNKYMKVNKM